MAVLVYFRLESTHLAGLVVWGLFSGLVLMVAGGILLSREVARPVQAVLEGMQAIQEGKGPVRVSAVAWDELADLALGFNNLARALEAERQHNLELYRDTVQTLAAAIDARDPYTRGHSQRVGAYAQLIARKLGWDEQKAYQLYITGLLHDIGKIGVSEAILQKTDKLSPQERQLIESHPLIGYEIARQSRALSAHLPGIRHHHERLDGGGYPDGLSGEAIPIEARILAVADVWDALTSHRPYRPALKPSEVYPRLWSEALDPQAVRALGELWQEGALDALLEEARRKTGQPDLSTPKSARESIQWPWPLSKTE
ncbi:metal-dependent phosphohydrolase [Meiothermus taiwanensis]|nr:metal-dependent phosphohydrolase [Meiothermus taiwanensis]